MQHSCVGKNERGVEKSFIGGISLRTVRSVKAKVVGAISALIFFSVKTANITFFLTCRQEVTVI